MNKKLIGLFSCFVFFLILASLGFKGEDKNNGTRKITTNDKYNYIAINQIFMWISNNGDGSHSPTTDGQGFFWPGGPNATKGAIFEDGLLWGGKIGREIRVGGSTYRHGLQAGKILEDGTADNPDLDKYRIYKIRKGWQSLPSGPVKDQYEKDYNEWPVEDGAPWVDVDGDGIFTRGVDQPKFVGDEVLWYVSNDLDPARTTFLYGTLPMGMEVQSTVFGFNRTGALGDMVFEKFKFINKGQNTIKDMIVGYWSDTDLGDANDDYTGCDTSLSLGYTYNANASDAIYGSPPPAIGYDFFQGPIVPGAATDSGKFLGTYRHGYKNLPMTAFAFYINGSSVYKDPDLGLPNGAVEFYNYMQGLVWDGQPFIDPNTQLPVKFVLAGDPVPPGSGWREGSSGWPGGPDPGDRRHFMASGPFDMAPGDTQEVVVGLVIAIGGDNLQSVAQLKLKDAAAQIAYNLDFQLTPSPPSPDLHSFSQDRSITLWWDRNAESYHEFDPLIPDTIRLKVNGQDILIPVQDRTFDFQGYRVFQYKDLTGNEPRLVATFDIVDSVANIWNYQYYYLNVNGTPVNMDPVISSGNTGLARSITITKDQYTNGPLYNGNPYYFAVTAYGYSPYSDPPVLESPPVIIEVFPGVRGIGENYSYEQGNSVYLDQTSGRGDGRVRLKVIDPTALTGHNYKVVFKDTIPNLKYDIIDVTSGDTVLKNANKFVSYKLDTKDNYKPVTPEADTAGNVVIDGFMPLVYNSGYDSITYLKYKQPSWKGMVKSITEVKGPGGQELSEPVNVYDTLNSTGEWKITTIGNRATKPLQNINARDAIGTDDYEIRFTDNGSQYYSIHRTTGIAGVANDTLAQDRVPFEVYDVGTTRYDFEKRLYVKSLDTTQRDFNWSQNASGQWEPIFAYKSDTPYSEPLPNTSGNIAPPSLVINNFVIDGNKPAAGTVIKIQTIKPLSEGDVFEGKVEAPKLNDVSLAKTNIKQISVFPNPYFGANPLERDKYQRFMRFTNLPDQVTIRIYSLSGVFIKRIDKDDNSQYLDWDLRNKDGLPVASGMYLAYLDMPGVGTKIMKLAVIMETQFIDRL